MIKIPHFVNTQTILKDPNFKSCRLLFLFDRKTFGFTSNTEQKRCEKEEKKRLVLYVPLGKFLVPSWSVLCFFQPSANVTLHRARMSLDMDAILNFDRFNLTEPRWALQPQGTQWFSRIGLFVVQAIILGPYRRPIEFLSSHILSAEFFSKLSKLFWRWKLR